MKLDFNLNATFAVVIIGLMIFVLIVLIINIVLKQNKGKLHIGKDGITYTGLDEGLISKQMKYAMVKGKIVLQEQLSLLINRLDIEEDSDAYCFYKLIIEKIIEKSLDLYRELFEKEDYSRLESEQIIQEHEDYLYSEARQIISERYRKGIMGIAREDMINKCEKGFREIFSRYNKMIITYARQKYNELKKG